MNNELEIFITQLKKIIDYSLEYNHKIIDERMNNPSINFHEDFFSERCLGRIEALATINCRIDELIKELKEKENK